MVHTITCRDREGRLVNSTTSVEEQQLQSYDSCDSVSTADMVQQCAGCELPIADKFLFKVLDRVWHANCVQCNDCKCSLSERCFSRDGKLFCRDDFYRRFGTKCSGCEQGISPNDLVRRAKHLVFHVECFVCSSCKRQISTGDELYYVGDGSFICKEDYYQHHHHQHNISDDVDDDSKDLSYGLDEDLDTALSSKRRGPRTTIKAKQLEALRATFAATPKPSRNIREKLAQETGLNMRVIQVWFQNRRSKERRLKQSGGQTQASRGSRPSRRSRTSRIENPDETNENETDLQSPSTPQIGFHHQELASQPPSYVSPNYNDYYSSNSPVSENMIINNQLPHNTDFVSPPNIRGSANPLNDMTDNQNHMANPSRILQTQNIMTHSPNGNQSAFVPSTQQGSCNIMNSTTSEVW